MSAPSILLIGPSPSDLQKVQDILATTGDASPRFSCAASIAAGVERLAQGGHDAAVLDLGPVDANSLDAFARVYEAAGSVPIIVLTSVENEELAVQLIGRGAQECLVKTRLDGDGLARAIRRALQRCRFIAALHAETANRVAAEETAAHLATFPDLNPFPVVEVHLDGRVTYANPAARRLLPDLVEQGFQHPWLAGLENFPRMFQRTNTSVLARELSAGSRTYLQTFALLEKEQRLRIYAVDITARKRAEDSRAASEQQFATAFDNAPVGMVLTKPDGSFVSVNRALCKMLGFAEDELLVKDWRAITHPEDTAASAGVVSRALKGEIAEFSLEKRYLRKDGSTVWGAVTSRLLRDASGQPQHFVSHIVDITARKQQERLLEVRMHLLDFAAAHALSEVLRCALDQVCLVTGSPIGFYHFVEADEKTLSLQAWSTRTVQEFCQAKGEGMHYSVDKAGVWVDCVRQRRPVIHNDYASLPHRKGLPDGHAAVIRELVVPIMRSGRVVAILGVGNKPQDYTTGDVETVKYLADVAWEIADRKRAEQALLSNEAKYRALVEHMSSGVVVCRAVDDGQDFIYTDMNLAAEHILKVSRAEMLGQRMTVMFPGYTGTAVFAARQRVHAGGIPEYVPATQYKDDRVCFWTESYVYCLPSGEIVTVFDDVSLRKETEAALRQKEAMLRGAQKMEAIGQLAGGVAHDFNNILFVIMGRTELLLKHLPADNPMRRELEMIHKSGQRAANLTRQLLAFSRRQVLRPKVVGLNTIVSEMTGMLRHLIPENIALNTALADDLSSVKADPSQIEQVLMNLAVNARDAMPNGGRLLIETANVTLDDSYCRVHPYVRPGRYVMLAVSDNGCGMTPDVKAHLFEPFFTTKEQGKGTGLGLATVYGIVKQSGGSIEAYSEPGRGTVFKTYLPVVAPSPTHTAVSSGTLPAVPGGGETILVVEDEDGVRDLIHDILQANGYKVLIAHDGAEALKLCAARKQPVSLVLTDMVMPGMSGLELSHLLARKHPSLKVIFMSGYTDLGVFAGDVLESGAAYLQKPFTPRVLTGTVRDVLDARLSDRRK